MRNIAVFLLVAAMSLPASPLVAAQLAGAASQVAPARPVVVGQTVVGAAALNPAQATISGTVATPSGQALTNVTVRARNLLTGQIGGSTSTTTGGQFSIVGLIPGNYVLEIVDAGGQIVGTSSFISAAAGTAVTTATVAATSGALGAVSATTGLVATLGATAARSVGFAAAAAGVAGVVVPPGPPEDPGGRGRGRGASPSR